MVDEELISVIVPVYNAQKSLNLVLESIINQTYANIEVILVDDGSYDDSLFICKSWAEKDSRIVVIHQENKGVSAARNAGIRYAHGKYIGFVDADDKACSNMYENLYKAAVKTGADIVACNVDKFFEKDGTTKKHTNYSEELLLDNKDALVKLFSSSVGPWNKLYKRYLFEYAVFQEGVTIAEDGRWFMDILTTIPLKVYFITDMLYFWTKGEGSATHNEFKPSYLDAVDSGRYYCKKIEAYDPALLSPVFTKRLCNIYLRTFTRIAWLSWDKIRVYKEYLLKLKALCRKDKGNWLKYKNLENCGNYFKIRLVCCSTYGFIIYKKIYVKLNKVRRKK